LGTGAVSDFNENDDSFYNYASLLIFFISSFLILLSLSSSSSSFSMIEFYFINYSYLKNVDIYFEGPIVFGGINCSLLSKNSTFGSLEDLTIGT
jgi:hypothetical protein